MIGWLNIGYGLIFNWDSCWFYTYFFLPYKFRSGDERERFSRYFLVYGFREFTSEKKRSVHSIKFYGPWQSTVVVILKKQHMHQFHQIRLMKDLQTPQDFLMKNILAASLFCIHWTNAWAYNLASYYTLGKWLYLKLWYSFTSFLFRFGLFRRL